MPSTRVLETVGITGATGFLGRHLVASLVRDGYRPVVFTRGTDGALEGAVAARLDLLDQARVRRELGGHRLSALVHLAGTRRGDAAVPAVAACAALNVAATVNLLAAAGRAGVERVVTVGSAEEYGDQPGPLHENLPLQAHTAYGMSKASATRFAQLMHRTDGCPVVVVRPFSGYGPGQAPVMFVAEAVHAAVQGLPFKMTHGRQQRDFVFVDDIVAGLRSALVTPGIEGEVINLGSGEPRALRDVAARIWSLAASDAPLLVGERPAPREELHDTWADTSRARRLLGWSAQVSLDEGLRRTIEWARHVQAPVP
jgi:nucleoside-diphosphate-sugar epimerase